MSSTNFLLTHLDNLYKINQPKLKQTLLTPGDQVYGEINFFSLRKLVNYLKLQHCDNFLDLGSGIGKLIIQLSTIIKLNSYTGIEINYTRHQIAQDTLNSLVNNNLLNIDLNNINFINADFLNLTDNIFNKITICYLCATAWSVDLINSIGYKINQWDNLTKIITTRKISKLTNFKIKKKLYLHTSWDIIPFYLYYK